MPPITPPSVTALPTPPSTASPSTFDTRADAFLGALPGYQTEQNALAANVYANAVDAATSATSAATQAGNAAVSASSAIASAAAAAASANAPVWANTGATYAIGDRRSSALNGRVYYRLTASSAGTTDPSVDTTNWRIVLVDPISTAVKTGAYAAVSGDLVPCDTTAGAFNVTLPSTPSKDYIVTVMDYAGKFATNNLTVLRNGSSIQGLAEDFICDINRETRTFVYIDATQGWEVI